MKFQDLKNLDKDDILSALGLQTRQTTTSWALGTVGVFGLGLLVGASVALLMSPKSGPELRRDLNEKIRQARNGGTRLENSTSGI